MSTSTLAAPTLSAVHPELQQVVEEGKLTLAAARTLSLLEPGAYCHHKSWGFGQVAAWNVAGNQILIDFGPRKSHPMQLQYAGDTLRPIAPDHVMARKASDLPSIKRMATEDPVALVRLILEHSDGKRATPVQIAALLTPDVTAGETEFKRWWDNTKKLLKKDGCFSVPAKRTEFVDLREEAMGHAQELIAQFGSARQLKDQLTVLDLIHKNIDDFKQDSSALAPILAAAGAAAIRNQRLDIVASFELLVTRDEIAALAGIALPPDAPELVTLMREEETRLGEIIGELPAAKQRYALNQLPASLGGDKWTTRALSLLPQTHNARIVGEVAQLFEAHGRTEELRGFIDRCIRDYSVSCEMLLWLCKERADAKYADFVGPRLFGAVLSALERDQYSDIKRSTKLRDLLMSDRQLVPELLAAADPGELRAAARSLLATPSLEELDKRSLMARLIKQHPDLHVLLTGGAEDKPTVLIVSWASLEKRKLEYEDLVNKKIPENSKEIGVARSYGDLRENFEFKAAKEMQSVLMRRKAELEQELARSRGTNFEAPDVTQVSIGTIATLKDAASGAIETYCVLGAWDGNPEKGIISYLTAIGQALLGHRIGEIIDMPSEAEGKRCEIVDIQPYRAVADLDSEQ